MNFVVQGLPSGIGVLGGETRGGKRQALEGKGALVFIVLKFYPGDTFSFHQPCNLCFVIIAGDNKFCCVLNLKVETLPVLTFRFSFDLADH